MTQLVTGSVPLLAAAPNGLLKTRELILSLAVRGRLVAQDPDEQSAQKLAESIRAAHPSLRGIPAAAQTPISDSEKRFDVPASWTWVRFGFATDCRLGKMLDKAKNTGEHRPYLRNTNVQWGRFDLDDIKTMQLEEYELDHYRVLPGDLLICEGGEPGRCAVWRDSQQTIFFQKALHRARPRNAISADFIQICLRADCSSGVLERFFTGATIKHLPGDRLVKYPFPLPPLAEQHRIVAKVDELMALCDRLEAEQTDAEATHAKLVEALLASLTQARDAANFRASWQQLAQHFHTLFTTEASVDALKQTVLTLALKGLLTHQDADGPSGADLVAEVNQKRMAQAASGRLRSVDTAEPADRAEVPYPFPASWGLVRISELCEPITSGTTPPSSEMDSEAGVPFLKVYNIRNQRIDFSYKPQFVNPEYHTRKMGRSSLKPLDVVMNIVGPPLGKVAIIPEDYPAWNCNQAIVFFRAIPPISHRYLYLFLCEGSFLKGIELIGTAGQDNISVTKSRNIPVPVPPVLEQHRIVAKVDELLDICDQLKVIIANARQRHEHLAAVLVEQAVS